MVSQNAPLELLVEEADQFDSVYLNEVSTFLSVVTGMKHMHQNTCSEDPQSVPGTLLMLSLLLLLPPLLLLLLLLLLQSSVSCAKQAAGALVRLVEEVVEGRLSNGMALIRPPGHHAEAHHARGFCILNNVAVAASYARRKLVSKH